LATRIRAFQIDPSVFSLVTVTFQQEAGSNLDTGRIVRYTGDGIVDLADNSSETNAGVVGITAAAIPISTQGSIQFSGLLDVEMELGLTLLFGDILYVGSSGMGTNVQTLVSGEVNCRIGRVSDSSAYNPGGPSPQYVKVAVNIDYPIVNP
jgi:hypothetical protein